MDSGGLGALREAFGLMLRRIMNSLSFGVPISKLPVARSITLRASRYTPYVFAHHVSRFTNYSSRFPESRFVDTLREPCNNP